MMLHRLFVFLLASVWACDAGLLGSRSLAGNQTDSSAAGNSSSHVTVSSNITAHSNHRAKQKKKKASTDDDLVNTDDDAPNDDTTTYTNDDDSAAAGSAVGEIPSGGDDDTADDSSSSKKKDSSSTEPKHYEFHMDETSNSTLFSPPDEVEPPFWKQFIFGLFLFVALIFCLLTARKTCCAKKGYQEIPSTTLVV